MLGDDAPGRGGAQYWFLNYDYQQADLVLNAEGQVKGGTLPALIERLTLHDGLDSNFIATFLLTYRSFTSTKELFTYLFHRFTIHPPMGLDPEELEIWTEKKLTPIRLRVFNIIKSWLETYYLEDETDDREALSMIKDFSGSADMKDTMSFAAVQLIKLVEKREQSEGAFRKMVLNLTTQAPQPITPRNLKKIKFLELDPLEFARQLTIMEANAYNKIKPVECLAKAWTSEDPEIAAKAVNIKKMIETSNLYSNWINELVLSEKELKKRVLVIRHLVMIAEKLRQLNNFSMLSATMAALSQSPIHRLKRTWEQVPSRTMTAFMDLQALMGVAKNWAEYREELHSVNPPCVPFVGMYLTDLVMIQDGNGDFLKKSNHLINFYKRVKTAEVIREIQQYQSVPYCLTSVPEIQSFIRRGQDCTKSVADLYEMSLQLEPRNERGDEKIARLLNESGML
ncbi:MAG: cell division control protein [Linnemannia elongata]|nr:MAG: cell division control protein [Linnemannia elongata]